MKKYFKLRLELALKAFARKAIKSSDCKIIGITGSVAKSSTKEAIYEVLANSQKYSGKVKKSSGNLNTEIGLPLAVFGYTKEPSKLSWPIVLIDLFIKSNINNPLKNTKILVLEYAADKPGDIQYLTSVVKPDIAVITKICAVHTEQFGSIDEIAKEKGYLAESVDKDGIVFLNESDKFSKNIAKRTSGKVVYFSDKGLKTSEEIAGKIGLQLGISQEEINKSLKKFKLPPGRLSLFKGIKDSIVIDSTYNASPEAVKEALDYLKRYKAKGRKVAILGDMRELGNYSENGHILVAKEIIKKADFAIIIGPEMQKWVKPVLDENKFPNKSFADFSDAKPYIVSSIEISDIILVKGSQNTLYLERVVELLLDDKKDITLLCRRGGKWDNIRNSTL